MNTTAQGQQTAGQAPGIIAMLLAQHAEIRRLFAQVDASGGEARQASFDILRELLAFHETGEEIVLRPVSAKIAGRPVADARNDEEEQAAHILAQLEDLDVDSAEFDEKFARFQQDVEEHAEREETEEFPIIAGQCGAQELREMGQRLVKAQAKAPTHPHPFAAGSPTAQRVMGPFAAMLDKARDAFSSSN